MQLKNKTTGQIIEVDDIDISWYDGHEDYEVLHAETTKTIETESWEAPKKEVLTMKKPGRPRKA